MRDNMNYQEYDWYFDPKAAPTGSSNATDPWATTNLPGTCIGQACCSDGQTWDPTINQCVGTSTVQPTTTSTTTTTATTTTETFVNNVLTRTSGNYKNDVDLNTPNPTNSDSFINYKL
jgi:hypothetical protein